MNKSLPQIYLVRHGETEWTVSRQHTGKTDLSLIEKGEADALKIGRHLENHEFFKVFSSPRKRAIRSCQLAGFEHILEIDKDLEEWDYGNYEGMTTKEIKAKNPDWELFTDGCPSGESVHEISERADRVIKRLLTIQKDVLIFSHGHFLRVLASRWICLPAIQGRRFLLDTSSISILGFEHTIASPVISSWNNVDQLN
jgi:broad specificity phosphatase PhoE